MGAGKSLRATGRCPCPNMTFGFQPPLDDTAWIGLPGGRPSSRTWLELRVSWDGALTAGLRPALVPPGGNTSLPAQRGFDDWRIQAFAPEPGQYNLTLDGVGDYTLSVRFLEKSGLRGAGPALLPDLVTLVPIDVRLMACDQVERTEQGATRCLRLSNGVGNIGDGPVQVYLGFDRGAMALTPVTEGRFIQRLFTEGGGHEDVDVGPATFHTSHRHWHYASLAHFALHAYDPVTGLRGGELTAHHKQGFCFLDWAAMRSNDTDPSGGSNVAEDCVVPGFDGWSMGVSRGYYDFYGQHLADQYVDVADVPDGVYELVATADGQDSLHELDDTNNVASVVLALHGEMVTVLEERGHYLPNEYPGSNPVAS